MDRACSLPSGRRRRREFVAVGDAVTVGVPVVRVGVVVGVLLVAGQPVAVEVGVAAAASGSGRPGGGAEHGEQERGEGGGAEGAAGEGVDPVSGQAQRHGVLLSSVVARSATVATCCANSPGSVVSGAAASVSAAAQGAGVALRPSARRRGARARGAGFAAEVAPPCGVNTRQRAMTRDPTSGPAPSLGDERARSGSHARCRRFGRLGAIWLTVGRWDRGYDR